MDTGGADLTTFLLWLRSQNFTGQITLHVRGGVPLEATWGTPNRVYLAPKPARQQGGPPRTLDNSGSGVAVSPQKKT